MKASTEEFLYLLLWTADSLMRPTWRNLHETFESWAFRENLDRRLAILEKNRLVECHDVPDLGRLHRLTEEGRRLALGGRDPIERWSRPWDGRWRFVLYDLPVTASGLRSTLRRFLLKHGFGYLQQSVWITPDSLQEARELLSRITADVESLTLFEGNQCGGEPDSGIVAGAWDFETINTLYEQHRKVVSECPGILGPGSALQSPFLAWARRERESWNSAVRRDPFLPRALLPADYAGIRSWEERKALAGRLGAGIDDASTIA